MDHALVLGADTRFGQAICRRLTTLGFRVFGLAREFDSNPWDHPDFVKLPLDLSDMGVVSQQIDKIHEAGGIFSIVVNATHYLPSQSEFSSIPVGELEVLLRIHHTLPLVVARLTLQDLSYNHGNFIHVVPSSLAESEPAAYAIAAQEPLKNALNAIQTERQHSGLRITHIYPYFLPATKNETGAETKDSVKVGIDSQYRLDPESVADAIEQLVVGREGNYATEIHLRPRTPRGADTLPRNNLKPSGYTAITLPPPEKAAPDQKLIATAKPIDPEDAKDRPVTYADVIDSYDEAAEEEFERRIAGVSEDSDEDFEFDDDPEDENIPPPPPKERRSRRRGSRRNDTEERPKEKKETSTEPPADSEEKPVSAKTLRNRERRRKWKERKAKERAEAKDELEEDSAAPASNESTAKKPTRKASTESDPAFQGHASAIAASKDKAPDADKPEPAKPSQVPSTAESISAKPKKAAKKKVAAKKKSTAAKKAVAKKAAPKKADSKPSEATPAPKKRAAKKKAAAKKKRTPAKKARGPDKEA